MWKEGNSGGGGEMSEEEYPGGFHAESEGQVNGDSNDFGDLRSPTHSALSFGSAGDHSVGHGIEVNENDEVSDFEAPTPNKLSTQNFSSHVKMMSVSDAFDELLADDVKIDCLLPPLTLTQTPVVTMPVELDGIENENGASYIDEFEDFMGIVKTVAGRKWRSYSIRERMVFT
jgi:hypothetical protein